MYDLLGISRKRTARYHCQCNEQDENRNKSLKR